MGFPHPAARLRRYILRHGVRRCTAAVVRLHEAGAPADKLQALSARLNCRRSALLAVEMRLAAKSEPQI